MYRVRGNRFGGDNSTFKENWANRGGAIFNGVLASITRPQDGGNLVFLNNGANVSLDYTIAVSREHEANAPREGLIVLCHRDSCTKVSSNL